jgi:hypothetical protein
MAVRIAQQQWAAEMRSVGSTAVAVMVAMAQRDGAAQWSKRKLGCALADSGCALVTWAAPKWVGLLSSARLYSTIPSVRQHPVVIFACSRHCVGADWYDQDDEDDNSNIGGNNDDNDRFYCVIVPLPVTGWRTQAKLAGSSISGSSFSGGSGSGGIGSGSCMEQGRQHICC